MTANSHAIAVVSDVSLGYGSPQAPALARSLAEHFGAPATFYEPDLSHRPPRPQQNASLGVRRIATDVTPYSLAGRIQYLSRTAAQLNDSRPAIVAIMNTYCLPVLAQLRYRPHQTVYVLSEMVAPYGRLAIAMNRALASHVDVVVFPEANRARLDVARCGLSGIPTAILYNCAEPQPLAPSDPHARTTRLFYGGAISSASGVAGLLTHRTTRDLPFDVYGEVVGPNADVVRRRIVRRENVRYYGGVDAESLAVARRACAYSLVVYRPRTEQTRYAAPNKFFEAIAAGVPPIATPHPQCREIVERYRCGLVARNWSLAAYRDALHRAMDLFGGPRYARLVENCLRATREELNWKCQFEKLRPYLVAAA